MSQLWQQGISQLLQRLWEQALSLLPSLVNAFVLILLGLVVGWVLKEIVYRLLRLLKFDRLCARLGVASVAERVGSRSSSYFVGRLVQGVIIVVALLAGLNALSTELGTNLVTRFVLYLPQIVLAGIILLLGSLLSRFLSRSVLITAVNAKMRSAKWLAGLVRFLVMALAVVAALEQLGIGRTTLLVAFGVVFGGVVAALAMALGLGGKDLAREWLESQLRQRPGQEEETEGLRHV